MKIISTNDLTKSYDENIVLKGIDLDIYDGEWLSIVGASGSGKSTLINILGCLDKATSGQYSLFDEDVSCFSDSKLTEVRRDTFGFIFQGYHLIPYLNTFQNIELPMLYQNLPKHERRRIVNDILNQFNLSACADLYPKELSGGMQQRVAICRALSNQCKVIIADEPTSALDSVNAKIVEESFRALVSLGKTIICVTHDVGFSKLADRIIVINDGVIE
ncbi:ABC transporter ATP-binding protein [Vibrio harveyi]